MSVLQVWEDETGEDFLVYGERYLDVLERLSRVEKAPPARNVPIFLYFANAQQRVGGTPASPTKPPQTSRAPSRAPPSRPPSVARSVPPASRTEPKVITTSNLTNPQTPSKMRRPLGTMSSQAASVRSVQESPSPSKPISLEHAHLKMRPPAIPNRQPIPVQWVVCNRKMYLHCLLRRVCSHRPQLDLLRQIRLPHP